MAVKVCQTCGRNYATEKDYLVGTSRYRKCDRGNIWFNCACESTLMLPKSMFNLYDPTRNLSSDAMRIFGELENLKNLPPISSIVAELEQALNKENSDSASLAKIVLQDPSLAAKVLTLANSNSIDAKPPVPSVLVAISVLGREQLRSLALTSMIRQPVWKFAHFSLSDHWEHALLAGNLARQIATFIYQGQVSDLPYLATVLSNLGRVVLGLVFPSELDLVAAKASKDRCSWSHAETAAGSYSHCLLGEIGSAMWGLPNDICVVALKHHDVTYFKKVIETLKVKKKLSALAEMPQVEVLCYVAACANDLAHDVMKQSTRKASGGLLTQPMLSAMYEMNVSPSKMISESFLVGIKKAAKAFVS
jgi:HD-like signal output (HDOD) protein